MSLRKKRPVKKKKRQQKGCYNCGNRVDIGGGQSVCRVYYPMVVIYNGRHAKEYNYCGRECWTAPEEGE